MDADAERVLVVGEDAGPELAIVDGEGAARALIWPGMGAELRSMHRITLAPGSRTTPLRHPGEAVYYVIAGIGEVTDLDAEDSDPLVEGSMAHVEPETAYAFVAGPAGLELVGGPAPADPSLYAKAGS
jgi:quercetin dioxygenase-like cupin family protein